MSQDPKFICFYDTDDAMEYDRNPELWEKLRKLDDEYEDDEISADYYRQERARIIEIYGEI